MSATGSIHHPPIKIPKVHLTVFEYNLQNILLINVPFVSVSLVGNVIKGKNMRSYNIKKIANNTFFHHTKRFILKSTATKILQFKCSKLFYKQMNSLKKIL